VLVIAAGLMLVPAGQPAVGAPVCTHTFVPADARTIPIAVSEPGTGRVFCFAAGTYDMNDTIVPHDGDQFIGAGRGPRGTILRGARTIDTWARRDGLYVHDGDVVHLELGGSCFGGSTTCRYPDWLFVDGKAARRALSPCTVRNVRAGTFCIDYSADTMYLPRDPATRRVEYGVVSQAIVGPNATGVTVTALRITKYANTAKQGAAVIAGPRWLIDRVDVNSTHSCALAIPGSETVVQASHLHHNGQFGFCGSGGSVGSVFTGNEVDHNNTLGFDANVGAGGGKFTGTLNLVLSGNDVHDNNGVGIWLDADNKGATIVGNTSKRNTSVYDGGDGIKVEVSCDVTITSNATIGNARVGIHVNNSQRVAVGTVEAGNRVVVPPSGTYGVLVHGGRREAGGDQPQCGPASKDLTVDNRVVGNDVTMPSNATSWNGIISEAGGTNVTGNTFASNKYHMADCTAKRWKWWDGVNVLKVTFAQWQGTLGQDPPPDGSCGP
jgi:parallel beta helix pectate lyase-like protein